MLPLKPADAVSRTIVKSDGIDIEVFEFGKGPETLIMAAGTGRPAAQLDKLADGIASNGIHVVTYSYRTLSTSTGQIDGLRLVDYANDLWRVANAGQLQTLEQGGPPYPIQVKRPLLLETCPVNRPAAAPEGCCLEQSNCRTAPLPSSLRSCCCCPRMTECSHHT